MHRTVPAAAAAALVLTFTLAGAQAPPQGGRGGPGPGPGMMGMPVDSFVAERDSMIQVILGSLGERKSAPAESVFKNLKLTKGVPADRFLMRMNAFSRALGVSCRHCHVPGHWQDEDKKPKEIARQMMRMNQAINEDYLAKMDLGGDEKPSVNCTTCHRGEVEPMRAARQMMRRQRGPGGSGGPPPGERR